VTKADREHFGSVIGALAEAFERDLTEGLVESYWLALEDLPLDAVRRGAKLCLQTRRFMPRPAEIRERAFGSAKLLAAEAWRRVAQHIRGSRDAEPLDPIARKVVSLLGGLDVLKDTATTEIHTWTAKRFAELYEEVAGSGEGQQLLAEGSVGQVGSGSGAVAERLVDDVSRKLEAPE